jgi:hypothetical protein
MAVSGVRGVRGVRTMKGRQHARLLGASAIRDALTRRSITLVLASLVTRKIRGGSPVAPHGRDTLFSIRLLAVAEVDLPLEPRERC